jgi:CRISPR-associated protein Cas1
MNPLFLGDRGYALKVWRGKLVIGNKFASQKYEFASGEIPYDTIAIQNHDGYVSFEALNYLSAHNVSLIFLNWKGQLESGFYPEGRSKLFPKLRLAQYRAFLDSECKEIIARELIRSKISACQRLLERFGLERIKDSIAHEGSFSQIYLSKYVTYLQSIAPKMRFIKRQNVFSNSRNWNAHDEVNSALNYSYSIIEAVVRRRLISTGFETSLGFVHHSYESKEALVYDFQDLFRWVAELAIIRSLESRQITTDDFYTTSNYIYRIDTRGGKVLIQEIANVLNEESGLNYSNEHRLFLCARALAQYLLGKSKKLHFNY